MLLLKRNRIKYISKTFLLTFAFLICNSTIMANTLKEVELLSNEGKYLEAYNMLANINENTAEYFYFKGLCMYHLNIDLSEAMILLTKALSANGPERSKLVLGLIYHRQNKYIEAVRLLKEFTQNTKNQNDKDLANQYIRYCQNANAVAHRGKNINILNTISVSEDELPLKYNEQDINGILVPKPEELNTRDDEKNMGNDLIMVLPKEAENISTVFYAAYVPGRPDNIDIFMVEVNEDGSFSEPENLGSSVNSPQDEMYPYFDEENQVLYFASKGHQSIGGFDIFMSYYNAGAESWSKPINIGLPFNSTSDDFLYIPLENRNEYIFATKRNTSFKNIDVVFTQVPPGSQYKTLITTEDITAFNSLSSNGNMDGTRADSNGSSDEATNDPVYRQLIEKALNHQVKADSMKRKVHEQQQKINVALGENRKMQLSADLKIMQEEYRIMQERANAHYDAVREYEKKNNIATSGFPEPKKEEQVTNPNNDIKVHEYTPQQPVKPVEQTKQTESRPTLTSSPSLMTESPKVKTAPVNKEYETSKDLPGGVVYTVQIGVFSKKVDKSNFYGLKQVFYYYITGRNLYKYYTGVFNTLEEARNHLTNVKGGDYQDAFIAAFYGREPVSVSKALDLQ